MWKIQMASGYDVRVGQKSSARACGRRTIMMLIQNHNEHYVLFFQSEDWYVLSFWPEMKK